MTPAHKELLLELQSFASTAATVEALMDLIAKRLHEKMTWYNWTGFYLVDPTDANYLPAWSRTTWRRNRKRVVSSGKALEGT